MNWTRLRFVSMVCVLGVALSGCGSDQGSAPPQTSYKEMKTMVVDILKSDDGKKAVEEALIGEKEGQSGQSGGGGGAGGSMGIKMLMPTQSAEQMKIAVKDTLISPEYKKEIEKIMTDPRFAGEFAKAINSQSKQLHMQLIKDPSYQKSIEAMLKSPELTKMYMDLTKTPEYRKQSMTVMHDAMQNPIFRLEVMNLLKTVVQEELQPKVEKKGGEQGGSGDQKQDGGGGEGEQGGSEGGQGGGQ
ncbi:spore gernimation protein [Paenibacillus sp. EKM202P]|uniref:spore germination lipoprotein GerD n=1 Tax=unclassified Paenibacillus TaxID=185978 RepID=UPI0013EE260F|nr:MULTISPECIES: spore germination lipoprotein GerD [unclassified Paenibacillus]KAF6556345.1 spore gernimation protein [Paenibacillus sp. EKM202P]KAF6562690.1 spore gernimation protein [Paenibacillus sp. EKM207P]